MLLKIGKVAGEGFLAAGREAYMPCDAQHALGPVGAGFLLKFRQRCLCSCTRAAARSKNTPLWRRGAQAPHKVLLRLGSG
jgi:hypothetical protein